MTTKLYDLIRWGSESLEGYAPAYCRICGATLSTFDKTAPIGERLRWNGCEHIEAARKCTFGEANHERKEEKN